MRVSYNWLQELVDVSSLSPVALAERLTMAGFEVEGIEDRRTWADGVVVGKILTAERHPDADRLQVCTVEIGAAEPLQIVCGAPNARAGLYVAVATVGTYLPVVDLKLRPTKLRGVRSEGMICSLAELGLAKESAGIHEFETPHPLGVDVRPILGLEEVILDVTSTANRADALSMVGIAREVAAFLGQTVCLPLAKVTAIAPTAHELTVNDLVVTVGIEDSRACPAYMGTLIEGVAIAPSPEWLQRRLVAAGMRPINNVVDVTNYVLLEWGQPLHAFDAQKLLRGSGDGMDPADQVDRVGRLDQLDVGVRLARAGETLHTLDDQVRTLTGHNLVITAADRPVAIAGVMGGVATEVSATTVDIFLEAALFDRVVVRRSARSQGLRTEASARYERGVNQAGLEVASAKAVALLGELAGGVVRSQVVVDHRPTTRRQIELRLERVWQILGEVAIGDGMGYLSEQEVEATLAALAFDLERLGTAGGDLDIRWRVTVPPFREGDIEREIDLIEEIARIYGYDRFCETLPQRTEFGYLSLEQEVTRSLRATLRGAGFTETLQMSLCAPNGSGQVLLNNPLAVEYGALRNNLLDGLIQACAYNLNQGNGLLWGFELGRVFGLDEGGSYEVDHLGGIFGGDRTLGSWQHQTQPLNWYEAKGVLETVFTSLNLPVEYQPDQKDHRFHPGRTASLWMAGERLGTFGELHPQLRAEQGLPDAIYAFELELDVLIEAITSQEIVRFQPYSTYPRSDRDLAFFASPKIAVADIYRIIRRMGGVLLTTVELIDEYRGEHVPEGMRSLAFRMVYQAGDRTLTDADIQPIHQQIREALVEHFQVILRS
ncbi:MAG: phenylalanine--tRNA ligase subunit beta [Oscillatoriales cyanobacterium SM2_2_1]|nr:phenylalanine--tRNA ligase subunit beta [Oscillatoriales cyanobacterium SM2_2_1]